MRATRLLILMLTLALLSFAVNGATVVKDTFQKTYHIDATGYPVDSCNVDTNWQSGQCSYLYACGVVVPKGSTSLKDAVVKECTDITSTQEGDVTITFVPPRGNRYAVSTFVAELNMTYDTSTYEWDKSVSVPQDYRSAEEAISLCEEGMMLKDNLCYPAQPVCLDKKNVNLCENPYDLYVLDYGNGFDKNNSAHYCADRDEDLVCDEAASFDCADTNENGVCDSDEEDIRGTACVDENQNGVCDDVESEGVFCRSNYDPVHAGEEEECVTYPNECFAEAAGHSTWQNGTCEPVYGDFCSADSDCSAPCDGVEGICKDPDGMGLRCFYTGECNPQQIQCTTDSDCPAAPCAGVTAECTSQNSCNYIGKCISKPTVSPSFWESIWDKLYGWISGVFI